MVDVEMLRGGLNLRNRRDIHSCKKLVNHGSWFQCRQELEQKEETSWGLNEFEVGVHFVL